MKEKNKIFETINESEQWYNTLFKNIPNVNVFLFDTDNKIILAQGTDLQYHNMEPATFMGKNFKELDLDKRLMTLLSEAYDTLLTGKQVKEQAYFEQRWYEIIGVPLLNNQNQVYAGLAVFINITEYKARQEEIEKTKQEYQKLYEEYLAINEELKKNNKELSQANKKIRQSEANYKAFVTQTTEGIYRFDVDKPIPTSLPVDEQVKLISERAFLAECNDALANIYGYKKEELLHSNIVDFHKKIKSQGGKEYVRDFVNSGYKLNNFVTEEYNSQGEKIYLSKNISGIVVNNELISSWAALTNITERKEYEKELVKAKQKAEESDQLKSAFLANMSHEIRTPLNGIMGFSYLLSKENLSKEQKNKFIGIIKNNGKQLLNLINDILDISKLEAGQIKIYNYEFSLNKLIKEVETLFQNDDRRKKKKLKLKSSLDLNDKDDLIMADKERLMQILQNLISNAIKFTESGTIHFGYKKTNNHLKFFVEDTGIGIHEEKQKEIFNRFEKDDSPIQQQAGGTGLGLSISKGLLELMDGNIWVESTEGEGSTFYFTIPYIQASSSHSTKKEEKPLKTLEEKTVLVVEDDKSSYELLLAYLKDFAGEILHAETGTEAIELFENNKNIDLILMDIRLPKMNGLQATREIRKLNKNIPIIAQSAYAMTEDRKKSKEAGCNDFITKPIDREKLYEILEVYLS